MKKNVNYNIIPAVIESTNKGNYVFDIYSKLLRERIIFLSGEICDDLANNIVAQLIHLDGENPKKDIIMYINSHGGSISSGMAIYDTMNYISSEVATLCVGAAYSMGAFLLSAGAKGKRYALPNSRIMIHQPLGGTQGQASDMFIQAKEITDLKTNLNYLLSLHTGKSVKKIKKDTDRDNFMSSLQALEYGIIDCILVNK